MVKQCAQDHTAMKLQSWERNLDSLIPGSSPVLYTNQFSQMKSTKYTMLRGMERMFMVMGMTASYSLFDVFYDLSCLL